MDVVVHACVKLFDVWFDRLRQIYICDTETHDPDKNSCHNTTGSVYWFYCRHGRKCHMLEKAVKMGSNNKNKKRVHKWRQSQRIALTRAQADKSFVMLRHGRVFHSATITVRAIRACHRFVTCILPHSAIFIFQHHGTSALSARQHPLRGVWVFK